MEQTTLSGEEYRPRLRPVAWGAEEADVTPRTVQKWIRNGDVPPECYFRCRGTIRLKEREFIAWLISGGNR